MRFLLDQRADILPAELLDDLPADHPDAIASRRDLRIFNAALGNCRWIRRIVPSRLCSEDRVLEIGSGTGELGCQMAAQGVLWDGLDRAPRPERWNPSCHWHQTDILSFQQWDRYPVVVGNLIFHHFDADQLRELGLALSRHPRIIVATDLRRGRIQQWLFQAFAWGVGANRVSRHDGRASIRAAFQGEELAGLLGLDRRYWRWKVEFPHLMAYRFIAERQT